MEGVERPCLCHSHRESQAAAQKPWVLIRVSGVALWDVFNLKKIKKNPAKRKATHTLVVRLLPESDIWDILVSLLQILGRIRGEKGRSERSAATLSAGLRATLVCSLKYTLFLHHGAFDLAEHVGECG